MRCAARLLLAPLLSSLLATPARAVDLSPHLDPRPPSAPAEVAPSEPAPTDEAAPAEEDAPAGRTPNPLKVDFRVDVPVTLLAGGLSIGLAVPWLAPTHCRICTTDGFDAEARELLKLNVRDASYARHASDYLVNAVMPVGILTTFALSERSPGGLRRFGEDVLVVYEAVAIAGDFNGLAKNLFARQRPAMGKDAMAGSRNKSFYSGHTSLAFSLATAAGTVASMRGYSGAPWVWAAGLTVASGVGYLRIAGDAHWATDVIVGAAAGGALGFAIPWFFHRASPGHHAVDLQPAPGGLAVTW